MTFEEKRAWVLGLLAVVTYAIYVTVIVRRADGMPLAEVPYVSTMLWAIGGSIIASIVLAILIGIVSPRDVDKKDQRDKEIYRFGEYTGQSLVIAGAIAALVMAMAELAHFWIANVIYLAFVLSAVLGSIVKIVAYRRGLPSW
ncbi:hypothetical protein [Allorhizocola rhizosphaerae]|uniref:hypothetical protein n=1 Tax=Allorhizocola rhizosphaerae TaxID=1872709 RepID=UPI000E3DAA0C|nr:hypothetical protein [Allorhizocola rhizosphaerae]